MYCAKNEVLNGEGDAYFERNTKDGEISVARGCILLEKSLRELGIHDMHNFQILEVGACYGYNLNYLAEKWGGVECFGIEPSNEAIKKGNELYKNITLTQGTADNIEYENEKFDIVMVGFCWFWVDRDLFLKSVAEVDRVLKRGGILAIWDFDTKVPYRRVNVHNKYVPTYKMNMGSIFDSIPDYYLMEKKSFSHFEKDFQEDLQERCALYIFKKETINNSYIFAE